MNEWIIHIPLDKLTFKSVGPLNHYWYCGGIENYEKQIIDIRLSFVDQQTFK